jgi:molecular chaperone DnaK
MTKDAEAHAKEDEEKKERIEARNQADALIFTAEKSLKDAGDKVAEDVKKEVEEKVKALKDILETGSKEDLETKTKELSDSLMKVGEAMNASAQPSTDNPQQTTPEGATEEKKEDSEEKKDKDEPVEGEVVDEGK